MRKQPAWLLAIGPMCLMNSMLKKNYLLLTSYSFFCMSLLVGLNLIWDQPVETTEVGGPEQEMVIIKTRLTC